MVSNPVGLAALSSTTQDVTVRFENLALIQQLVGLRDRQAAAYKVESVLFVTSGEEKLDIKTSNTGSVDLRSLVPPASNRTGLHPTNGFQSEHEKSGFRAKRRSRPQCQMTGIKPPTGIFPLARQWQGPG